MDKTNFHIITILGISGFTKDEQGQEVPAKRAFYEIDKSLEKLPLKAGEFHNVTHFLFESFDGARFDFIATSEALKTQKSLFNKVENAKFSQHLNEVKTLSNEDEFEDIFSQTLDFIKNSKSENIILDITHGLRHQPIIASFASVLGRVNEGKNIQIIFAKELVKGTKYSFISLDKYLEISLVAIALNSFVQNLSVPQIPVNSAFVRNLDNFTKALHSNAFNQIFNSLNVLINDFQNAKFEGLESIFENVKNILDKFRQIQNLQKDHQKYFKLAEFMFKYEYYLISVTYIREAILLYLLDIFTRKSLIKTRKSLIKKGGKIYDKTDELRDFMVQICRIYKENDKDGLKSALQKIGAVETLNIAEKYKFIIDKNGDLQKRAAAKKAEFIDIKEEIFDKIKDIRNDLVHLNKESDRSVNKIKNELSQVLDNFNIKCLKNDCLKDL